MDATPQKFAATSQRLSESALTRLIRCVHGMFPKLRELKLAKKVIGKQWFKGTAASRIYDQGPAKARAEQVIFVALHFCHNRAVSWGEEYVQTSKTFRLCKWAEQFDIQRCLSRPRQGFTCGNGIVSHHPHIAGMVMQTITRPYIGSTRRRTPPETSFNAGFLRDRDSKNAYIKRLRKTIHEIFPSRQTGCVCPACFESNAQGVCGCGVLIVVRVRKRFPTPVGLCVMAGDERSILIA